MLIANASSVLNLIVIESALRRSQGCIAHTGEALTPSLSMLQCFYASAAPDISAVRIAITINIYYAITSQHNQVIESSTLCISKPHIPKAL